MLIVLTSSSLSAQIQVTPSFQPPYNPINLIEDVFLNNGIVIQSVVYEGEQTAVGYFNTGSNDIDIERGLVLSTGFVNNIDRLNNSDGTSGATSGTTFTDADLELIAGNTVQDISRYIITFKPLSDTIRFRYVFASEEYPEFSCGTFNDPFGFFLSGPGISGPFSNMAENLALIPGTTTPVTVNSVNGGDGTMSCTGSNAQFYNDNVGGPNLEFDGYLSVFEVVQAVQPCQTYTLKIAIGDAGQASGFGDNAFDSAVFLEGNSFSSDFVMAERITINQNGIIQEGCASGSIKVSLPSPISVNDTLNFNIGGNATNGTDYTLSDNNRIIIPAGDSVGILSISALEDNTAELNDTLIISLEVSACQTDTFVFYIYDNSLQDPDLGEDQAICLGEAVQLYPTYIPVSSSEMTFTNSNPVFIPDASSLSPGATVFSSLMVAGVEPIQLGPGIIKSVCIDVVHSWDADLNIFLQAPDGSFIELTTNNGGSGNDYTMTCFVDDNMVPLIAEPGMLAPEPDPKSFPGNWRPEGTWSDLWENGSTTNGEWKLLAYDSEIGPGLPQSILNFSITFNATYQVSYDWNTTQGLSCTDCANPKASPNSTTEYILDVTDNNGCQKMDTILITVIDTIPAPVPICVSNSPDEITISWNRTLGATGYQIKIGTGDWVGPNLSDTSHLITNLDPEQAVNFELRSVGACEIEEASYQCQASPCIRPTIILDSVDMVLCAGQMDGAIYASATSPMATSFTFLLEETSQITPSGNFTGLGAGTYTLIVQDNFGCFDTLMVDVTEPLPLATSTNIIQEPICPNGTSAQGEVIVMDGTGPYSYIWSNGSVTNTISTVGQGKHFVTVTDANNCTTIDSITFTDPPPYDLMVTSVMVSCNGADDGTATALATNGNAPYSYLWDTNTGSQMTSTATNLSGGNFTVIVTDDDGCIQIMDVDVDEKSAITTTVTGTDATCDGIDDGTAQVVAGGGAGNFSYLWNDPMMQTSDMPINMPVGYAVVSITDSDGCLKIDSVEITSPPAMTGTTSSTPVTCSGFTDGGASISVMGGAGDYIYDWSDGGAMTSSRTNLASGDNIVTVTDANGCRLIETIIVPNQNPIFISFDSTVINCFGGNNGSAQVNVSGGVPGFTFSWNDPTSSASTSISNVTAGYYRVTVTDANNCFEVDSVQVTQNEGIQLQTNKTDIECFGDGDGIATVSATNGITIDTYAWDDPSSQSSPTASNLDGGNYKVVVTYNGICQDSATATINEPALLDINIVKQDITCNGDGDGQATANPEGGTGPFTFSWNDVNSQNTPTAIDLAANIYNVTVEDNNGCKDIEMVTIIEPPELLISSNSGPVDCFNSATGDAVITPSGGSPGYIYSWSDALSTDSIRSDLLPQKYIVTVTDNTGCISIDSVEISNQPELFLNLDSTVVSCFGGTDGSAQVIASGGAGGFMYNWNDPSNQNNNLAGGLSAGTYTVTVSDANFCVISDSITVTQNPEIVIGGDVIDANCFGESSGFAEALAFGGVGQLNYSWNDPLMSNTPDLINIPLGNYTVTVSDDLGCTDSLTFTVNEPDTLTVAFDINGLLCFGDDIGSITALPSGGNTSFNYLWDDPGGQTAQTAVNLMEGLYTVTVTDNRSCIAIDTFRLVEPELLIANLDSTNVLCNAASTGTITSSVSGGTPGYTYFWNNGITEANPIGLVAGAYSVTITDDNGCQTIVGTEITEPTAIVIDNTKTDIDCFGNVNGAIDVTTSGGVIPYTFDWNTNQSSEDISDLGIGNYSITVIDGNGCESSSSIVISSPLEISQNFNTTNVRCFGEMTGLISTITTGGTGDFSYEWSNGSGAANIMNLTSDTYIVTVTDQNGCIDIDSVSITEPETGISVNVMTQDLICYGDGNGLIDLDVAGGTSPYRFQLNNEVNVRNNPVIQGLDGGTYTVEIIDNNNCVLTTAPVEIFEPQEILVGFGSNVIIELGIDTVQLIPGISGGQGALNYEYTGADLSNLSCIDCPNPFIRDQFYTKEYTLVVTDQQGCTGQDNVIVIISKDRRVWVPTGFTPNTDSANDILVPLGDPNTLVLNFQIFDRWGTLIFEQSGFNLGDLNFGWDGTFKGQKLDPGVFVWKAEVQYFEDGIQEAFAGQTYLIR